MGYIILNDKKSAKRNKKELSLDSSLFWSERRDLNPRPLHPQYSALPDCATLRRLVFI